MAHVNMIYDLKVGNELRLLIGKQSRIVTLQLLSGEAEMYGTEMVLNKEYTCPPISFISVYTWHGCILKVTGDTKNAYVAEENRNMIHNVTFHAMLEERRIKAKIEDSKGPRAMVVGPMDVYVEKNALCRILLNYASRMGRQPLFIDLDVGPNSIVMPGTISLLNIEQPAKITNGFNTKAVQLYPFGYKSPGSSIILYLLLLKKLEQVLQSRLRQARKNCKTSGVIISSSGWSLGLGYTAITLAAMSFEIDILCVLGMEQLYTQLQRDMPSCVKVIFIPKLDCIIAKSKVIRKQAHYARVREYFYGPTNQLQPYTITLNYSDIIVVKVKSEKLGDNFDSRNVNLKQVNLHNIPLGDSLMHQVLAVSSAESVSKEIILTCITGFIWVIGINKEQGTIQVLSPQPSPLQSKIFLMGDIKLSY